ncbi:MAG TPA: hypothetical protein GX528_02410 [Firmicutes bacterium]|nr:hypothetical protein [Bacillota bacterium]
MAYREQLRQAREILQGEIERLHQTLAAKELDLRKLDGLLTEKKGKGREQPSLTSQVVGSLYTLAQESPEGVPARAVVHKFARERRDVNESTIRSTLYQVTRKMRPTEISVGDQVKKVRVLKNGPLYDVELVGKEPPQIL